MVGIMNLQMISNLKLQQAPGQKPYMQMRLQDLVDIGAEQILAEELKRYNETLTKAGSFQVGLMLVDNTTTPRELLELKRLMENPEDLRKGWLSLFWYVSDHPTRELLVQTIAEQIFKSLRIYDGKLVRTLSELVNLEAQAMRFSKSQTKEKKRQLWFTEFAKYLLTADVGTMIACFYGDEAARRLGYRTLGFPTGAGRIYANWMA